MLTPAYGSGARDWTAVLDRPVLFFGGKGGVGKTTLASATAVLLAEAGHRTLLVSTDLAHSTSDALEVALGAEPREVLPDLLWAVEIDPEVAADSYIAEVKARIADATPPRLAAEVERQIDIARVTPGAQEAALFDRFTQLMEEAGRTYDRVIFDTAPLGHTLRLLALPEQLRAWIGGLIGRRQKLGVLHRLWRNVAGAAAGDEWPVADPVLQALEERRTRFEAARATVTDPAQTAFVFVVIPEWLPIAETERAVRTLRRYEIPVGAVLVNQISPMGAAGDLASASRGEVEMRREITRRFADIPRCEVPRLWRDVRGVGDLRRVAAYLDGDGRQVTW